MKDEDTSPLAVPLTPGNPSNVTSPDDFVPFEDEGALLGDMSQIDEEMEEDGEELFGDNMEA